MNYKLINNVTYNVVNTRNINMYPQEIEGTVIPSEIISKEMRVNVNVPNIVLKQAPSNEFIADYVERELINEIAKELANQLQIVSTYDDAAGENMYSVNFSVNDLNKLPKIDDRLMSTLSNLEGSYNYER